MKKHNRKSSDPFVMHPVAMLRSPAFQVLSRAGHKVLACIEIEHCAHGGKDNGRLPVTHEDFRRFGIDHDSICPAIREVVALGFIEITQRGVAGNGEHRKPNLFRATYLSKPPTNEWAAIDSVAEAKQIAAAARTNKQNLRPAIPTPGKSKITTPGFSESHSGKPGAKNGHYHSGFPGVRGQKHHSGNPGVLSRYSTHVAPVREGSAAPPPAPAAPASADPKSRKREAERKAFQKLDDEWTRAYAQYTHGHMED